LHQKNTSEQSNVTYFSVPPVASKKFCVISEANKLTEVKTFYLSAHHCSGVASLKFWQGAKKFWGDKLYDFRASNSIFLAISPPKAQND